MKAQNLCAGTDTPYESALAHTTETLRRSEELTDRIVKLVARLVGEPTDEAATARTQPNGLLPALHVLSSEAREGIYSAHSYLDRLERELF